MVEMHSGGFRQMTNDRTAYRYWGLGSFILSAACWAGTALAQVSSGESSAGGNSDVSAPDALSEVVVTAQRREETVQKSSLSISVLQGDALRDAGVTQAKDLSELVPGLQIVAGGNTLQTYIRGVGDFSSSALGQSAVAYNYDGVYVADTASVGPLFYDVARTEVLKGPQGTLYGRNASAGALNIDTNRPTLGEWSGEGFVEGGDYSLIHASGAVNAPVGDTMAVRGAFNYVKRDGYLTDGTDDDDQRGGRLEFLAKPNDSLSLLVEGDIENVSGAGAGAVLNPAQPGTTRFTGAVNAVDNAALLAASTLPPFTPGAGLPPVGETGLLRDSYVDNTQRNASAELNYYAGPVTITFVPAYRTSDNRLGDYLAGEPFMSQERTHQQSYELRAAYDNDWLKSVAGFYYLDLDQFTAAQVYVSPVPGFTTNQAASLGTRSYAPFAQGTFSLTDRFRLIAGARFTSEDRSIHAVVTQPGPADFYTSTRFNAFTFRAGAEYDITADSMAYFTISKGFKSGGFNVFQPAAGITNVFQPETLYSYTLGIRNLFLDNRVRFNLEGFYWDYRNSQQNHLAFDPEGSLQFLTFNAASATLYGFDADLAARITARDSAGATLSYLHSKFDDFVYETPLAGSVGCATSTLPNGFVQVDCSGRPLPRGPKWSGTLSYQHRIDLSNGDSLALKGDINFASSRYLAVDYIDNELAPGYVRENASLTYSFSGDRVSVTAFAKNISNRLVPIGGIQAPFAAGFVYETVDAPRTFGGRVQVRF
jgi:iron complex outermembrane recepter protein